MGLRKSEIKNGLVVATDKIDSFKSVSLGLFVNIGSVNESEDLNGASHFVEHMVFKGTNKRSAFEISNSIESVGGSINAFTSKEMTAYHAKVLDSDVELAVDIIFDIAQNSQFDEEEFEKERGVIEQEIKQLEDNPDELVFDLFQAQAFLGESIGRPILGSLENIRNFRAQDIKKYLKNNYSTSKMIFCASGNVEHEFFEKFAQKYSDSLSNFKIEDQSKQKYIGGFSYKQKDSEQAHIIIGYEGKSSLDEKKYDLSVLTTILGGGMSSRLFQEIREKRGLVYNIFAYNSHYKDTGTFGIYAGAAPSKAEEVAKIVYEETRKIEIDITPEEIDRAKKQIKASILMELESSSVRVERMSGQYLRYGRFLTIDEISDSIERVSKESIINVLEEVLNSRPTVAVIGPDINFDKVCAIYS